MPNGGPTLNCKEHMLFDNYLAFDVLPSPFLVLYNITCKDGSCENGDLICTTHHCSANKHPEKAANISFIEEFDLIIFKLAD